MTAADYKIALPVFEGPLDLLLHLVRKHELDIFDIPVSFITERYLAYLELMRQMNLEVAGEYLLMAATLAHIKSRELLPTPDPSQDDPAGDGDEEIDTRQELIRRLLEYQKYREAAAQLGGRPVVGRNVWTRGATQDDSVDGVGAGEAPLAEIPLFALLEALADVLARARVTLSHEVIVERLSITDRIHQIVLRLDRDGTFSFRSCFLEGDDGAEVAPAQLKHHIVVTFLAVLEMARLKMIRITQPDARSDIHITRAATGALPPVPTAVPETDDNNGALP